MNRPATRIAATIEGRSAVLTGALAPIGAMRPVTTGRYLVKGFLDRGALSVLYGPSNVGKSFLALDLAAHLSAGRAWFGCRVADAGPAIYVAAEGGVAFGNRLAALRKARPDVFDAAARRGMAVLTAPVDLCRANDAEALAAMIDGALDVRPSLIVIDTLARSLGIGNENEGGDMAAFVASCGHLQAATGAHVLVVHHVGKSAAKGLRGHSSLHAAIDSEIELTAQGDTIRLEVTKQREMAVPPPLHFELRQVEIGRDEDGDPVTSAVVDPVAVETRRGALARNEARKAEAEGRATAALRHLPAGQFSAAEAGASLAAARVIEAASRKSAATVARRILRKLVEGGHVLEVGDQFEVASETGR